MSGALDFFRERVGRHIDPSADVTEILMRSYPHIDPAKKGLTRMGTAEPARFLITEDRARIWAPIRLPDDAASTLEIAPMSARRKRDWAVDILMAPPSSPFLAASLGMSAADISYWRMSLSDTMVVFGGNASVHDGENVASIDRKRFLDAMDWFKRTGIPVSDILRRGDVERRFKVGLITGEQARNQLARIKTLDELKTFPGGGSPFEIKLAAYAANEWTPQ